MTGDDLKRVQDHFLEGAKTILRERGYTTGGHVRTMGKSSVVAECPFCASSVTIYLWSIAGNGKKLCACGAALHADRIARKLVEVTP